MGLGLGLGSRLPPSAPLERVGRIRLTKPLEEDDETRLVRVRVRVRVRDGDRLESGLGVGPGHGQG